MTSLDLLRLTPAGLREKHFHLCTIINDLGRESAKAQNLHQPITSFDRCAFSSDCVLYLLLDQTDGSGLGLLRLGTKQLFLVEPAGQKLRQFTCTCVLDFYVRRQRQGLGQLLFDTMLKTEPHMRPELLALDRPSDKFLGFMRKHYGLRNFRPQSNKFVVFDEFFLPPIETSSKFPIETRKTDEASQKPRLEVRGLNPDYRRRKLEFN